jgi:diguanylate cyclase (GGDEF)-like protein
MAPSSTLFAIDIVGRWGGEEFVVLLPETDAAAALKAAERIRAAIAKHRFSAVDGARLTCSIGVATRPDDGGDRDILLASADRAMYTAKQLGRNKVTAASLARRQHAQLKDATGIDAGGGRGTRRRSRDLGQPNR